MKNFLMPKILIVGTVSYNPQSTSRAFDAYFHNWDKECLAQVFSNTKAPIKGHCSKLYQITDQNLVKKRFNKNIETGKEYIYENLDDEWKDFSLETNSKFYSKLYNLGKKESALKHLIRKLVWKKKYWCTDKFNKWLDEFSPECVFLSFSDDFFIPDIALYVAKKFNIPIVSSIGDDYYFNNKFSLSPFYYLYRHLYKKTIRKVFKHSGSAIFISEKIKAKYNSEFNLNGETVYLISDIKRKEFQPIDLINPSIVYCGNIRLGRNNSLYDIAVELGKINKDYKIKVYSNEKDKKYIKIFKKNSNIDYCGTVPYSKVKEIQKNSDITLIVEGFSKNDILTAKYSLSTKVADGLASGSNLFAYGSIECGAIEYMQNIASCPVCTKKNDLQEMLKIFLENVYQQKNYYFNAIKVFEKNHNLYVSTKTFEKIIYRAINKQQGEDNVKR